MNRLAFSQRYVGWRTRREYIKLPSHVTRMVQVKPQIDMKPKRRLHVSLILRLWWTSLYLQDGLLSQPRKHLGVALCLGWRLYFGMVRSLVHQLHVVYRIHDSHGRWSPVGRWVDRVADFGRSVLPAAGVDSQRSPGTWRRVRAISKECDSDQDNWSGTHLGGYLTSGETNEGLRGRKKMEKAGG